MSNHNTKRGDYVIAPGLTMRDLYKIVRDRLEYARCKVNVNDKPIPLQDLLDIDAICQTVVWLEVEKALGIHPNLNGDGIPAKMEYDNV